MNTELQEIESNVQSGDLGHAEALISKVLVEHPKSAKAHYVHAQILAKSHHYDEAKEALLQAKTLDPTLKFAHPEALGQFEAMLDVVLHQAADSASIAKAGVTVAPGNPQMEVQSPILQAPVLLCIGVLVALAVLSILLRRMRTNSTSHATSETSDPVRYRTNTFDTPHASPTSYSPQATVINNPPQQSSGAGMAVAAGLGGLAAGMALERALNEQSDRDADRPTHLAVSPWSTGLNDASVQGSDDVTYASKRIDSAVLDVGNNDDAWDGASTQGSTIDTTPDVTPSDTWD